MRQKCVDLPPNQFQHDRAIVHEVHEDMVSQGVVEETEWPSQHPDLNPTDPSPPLGDINA